MESLNFSIYFLNVPFGQIAEYEDPHSNSSSDMDEYGSDDDLDEPSLSPPTPARTVRPAPVPVPAPTPGRPSEPVGEFLQIQDYMELMDRELSTTKVGQSFEREQVRDCLPVTDTSLIMFQFIFV